MNWTLYIFYFFAGLSIVSASGILFIRNILHGAFLLILSFFSVAALYIIANASFIGVTQLLVYVGGIMVVMIFGIMLTSKLNGKALQTESHNKVAGLLISSVFFVILCYIILSVNFDVLDYNSPPLIDSISFIGVNLMSTYLVPFEVVAILLLIALVGASVLSEKRKEDEL